MINLKDWSDGQFLVGAAGVPLATVRGGIYSHYLRATDCRWQMRTTYVKSKRIQLPIIRPIGSKRPDSSYLIIHIVRRRETTLCTSAALSRVRLPPLNKRFLTAPNRSLIAG